MRSLGMLRIQESLVPGPARSSYEPLSWRPVGRAGSVHSPRSCSSPGGAAALKMLGDAVKGGYPWAAVRERVQELLQRA